MSFSRGIDTPFPNRAIIKPYATMDSSNFTPNCAESTGTPKINSDMKLWTGNSIFLWSILIWKKPGIWLLQFFSKWNAGQEWKPSISNRANIHKEGEKLLFIWLSMTKSLSIAASQETSDLISTSSTLNSTGFKCVKSSKKLWRAIKYRAMDWLKETTR